MPSVMPPRRKKWTEEEERTLIDKYGEMLSDGTLAKMKTREKKFRPIATHVNVMHHNRDPILFPWQWSWKDASTKVQNMRHQYLLVKQKIKKPGVGDSGGPEDFDWVEGLTHWPNFLRYKDVFGDVGLGFNGHIMTNTNSVSMMVGRNFNGRSQAMSTGVMGPSAETGFGVGFDGMENGVLGLGLGFEYEGEEGDENDGNLDNSNAANHVKGDGDEGFGYEEMEPELPIESVRMKKKSKLKVVEKRAWAFMANQLGQLRERETRLENQEAEREKERQRREQYIAELEEERERNLEELEKERVERERVRENMRREREREWEEMEKQSLERERRWREEELKKEREWEEQMDRRRLEWRKRMDDMLSQHRMAMDQLQSRIIQDQQSVVNQLLGIVTQWTGHPAGLSDHTGAGNPYLSQMMQNLHHVNGIVHGENRVAGDGHEDQFIVDG